MATTFVRSVAVLVVALAIHRPEATGHAERAPHNGVFALFDLGTPESGPFPSDIFTVEDATENTGRRLAHPYPDCVLRPSDCDDLDVVNTLDGWGLQTRVSVPFSGDIALGTVTSDSIFVVSLGSTVPGNPPGGERIGINQVVWDVATHTLHFEVDRLLDQHRRYGVIVTREVLDTRGKHVKQTEGFENHAITVPPWYATQIDEALAAAHALGVPPGHVVTASVFTTQTITSVMERIRDQIKAETPAPADFLLGSNGERTVFKRADVESVVFRQDTTAPGVEPNFPVNLAQLDALSGAVGTLAYGRYVSPDYLVHPGEYIPAVGTLAGTPPIQGYADVYFTLYLPSGPKPPGGWPIVLTGGGTSTNQHFAPTTFGSKLASHGLATIGISQVGQGFGPLGRLIVTRTDGTMRSFPDAGRGVDQNGDGIYWPLEGSEAAAPRTWTISGRDTYRQMVIDLMQLVRVIQVGMDVDGDWVTDIDPTRIYYLGASAGTMMGASFVALDPAVSVAAFVSAPGVIPEHARWQPVRRQAIGAALGARTPSLVNTDEGLTSIDGVAVAPPYLNENKPLRDQPVVINTVAGATDIQKALEWAEMAAEAGISAVPWAKYLRAQPLRGSFPKSILYQLAKGDQQAVNPGMSALIREGDLADRTMFYRHDLASAFDPRIPTNPHLFAAQPTSPNATVRAISLAAQEQLATFFASHGALVIDLSPSEWFEVPLRSPLPETLNFIR